MTFPQAAALGYPSGREFGGSFAKAATLGFRILADGNHAIT